MESKAARKKISLNKETTISLNRLMPRIEAQFREKIEPVEWEAYINRLKKHFPKLFDRLYTLYGDDYDFFYYLENILSSATRMWMERPDELKALDAMREIDPRWFLSRRMVGAMCYVDLFAGDLQELRSRISYLSELGITYLHLMPVFKVPKGDNDGGYAVSSFREINPSLGTMGDLAELTTELRHHGISLVLDFVINHTSDEHEWARKAISGDEDYQEYYRIFSNRKLPDQFEASIGEIFPDDHPGAFTYHHIMKKWVWTSFNTYQWDLNYEKPEVFNRMMEEMLFLANHGVEVLRLDAVAFLWKELGTDCQNLPQVHTLLQAFSAVVNIVAPALVFKSEAIVHPDEVRKYISLDECPLSYNPELMALLWDAMATRDVRMLKNAMQTGFDLPEGCAWINYVRCHDDIGWGFSDEDIKASGFKPKEHRRFLTNFYTGKHVGSFARGLPFQVHPLTGDSRVSGTCASLCGLEKAIEENDENEIDLSIRRIHLIHGIIITMGGIPLIYLGDEIGMLNDYTYDKDPDKIGDSRWVHRAAFDWERAEERGDDKTPAGRIFQGILRLIQLRHRTPAFEFTNTEIVDTGNKHVFGYFRSHEQHSVFVLANFSEKPQSLEARRLRMMGMRKTMIDLFAGRTVTATQELSLDPYQLQVLSRVR
jgi:amylosucrase/maltose alpha-D-glucosyltransferase/alpha-amylase